MSGGAAAAVNNVGKNIGAFVSHPFGSSSGTPEPVTPPPAPTLAGATQTAVQNQLAQEVQSRASQTLFTGGQGVSGAMVTGQAGQGILDSASPASRTILGIA